MDDLKDLGGKRRTWSKLEKRRIIAEALAPGVRAIVPIEIREP